MSRVAVALSGGVDSAMAAWLLREQGHEVIGLSMRLGQGPDRAWQEGAQVADQLGLPHQVVEAGPEFAGLVLEPSLRAYAAGMTPNPCALCNAGVKFPLLWRAARELGCSQLATGHYARLTRGPQGPGLAEARQRAKSQAYFLARLEQELLGRVLFPLAELDKPQVRRRARELGLGAAERPESQDSCFLPAGGWDELMAARGLMRPGPIEDEQGRPLGSHAGIHRFTIGQRRGLGVALGRPAYVLALDGGRAAVTLGPEAGLFSRGLWGDAPLWFAPFANRSGLCVRVRYAHAGVACQVEETGQGLRVEFAQPQRAVAPGQLAVFCDQDQVVGSAWITKAIH